MRKPSDNASIEANLQGLGKRGNTAENGHFEEKGVR